MREGVTKSERAIVRVRGRMYEKRVSKKGNQYVRETTERARERENSHE